MPSSIISTTFVPSGIFVPEKLEDIDEPEEFMKQLIAATKPKDLPKTIINARGYKIIGKIIRPDENIDALNVSEEYKIILKNRGRHVNQDIRMILKMICEMYIVVGDLVLSTFVSNMARHISTRPAASVSFKILSSHELNHIITIRYRSGNKALYVDMCLKDIISSALHLLRHETPMRAFCTRHVNIIMAMGPHKDTFSARPIPNIISNIFGGNAREFDRMIKYLIDDTRPAGFIIHTEHIASVLGFITNILCAIFGIDAHVIKKSICNHIPSTVEGYKKIAEEYEDEYGPPGVIIFTPRVLQLNIEAILTDISWVTVVSDPSDVPDVEGITPTIIVAEPTGTYHESLPFLRDVHDYILHLRNTDTESESEEF